MDIPQEVVNWALGGVSALLGWGVRSVQHSLSDLQKTDKELSNSVHDIALVVSGLQQFQTDTAVFRQEVLRRLEYIAGRVDAGNGS
jgi:hypothetical protein